ncbi:MAG: ankyrin repeat domain-containing protein [Fibrobacterales bacterium]
MRILSKLFVGLLIFLGCSENTSDELGMGPKGPGDSISSSGVSGGLGTGVSSSLTAPDTNDLYIKRNVCKNESKCEYDLKNTRSFICLGSSRTSSQGCPVGAKYACRDESYVGLYYVYDPVCEGGTLEVLDAEWVEEMRVQDSIENVIDSTDASHVIGLFWAKDSLSDSLQYNVIVPFLEAGVNVDSCMNILNILSHLIELRADSAVFDRAVKNSTDLNKQRMWNKNPMHWAIDEGDTLYMEILINNGLDVTDTANQYLEYAATEVDSSGETVKYLIQKGAPLHFKHDIYSRISSGASMSVLNMINGGIAFDDPSRLGGHPIFAALANGHTGVARTLLKNMHDSIMFVRSTEDLSTPFDLAVMSGDTFIVNEFIQRGVHPDSSMMQRPPLTLAIKERDRAMVNLLIRNGGTPGYATSVAQHAPMYVAVKNGIGLYPSEKREQLDIVSDLLEAGIDKNVSWGDTTLFTLAIERDSSHIFSLLLDSGVAFSQTPDDSIASMEAILTKYKKKRIDDGFLRHTIEHLNLPGDYVLEHLELPLIIKAIVTDSVTVDGLLQSGGDINSETPGGTTVFISYMTIGGGVNLSYLVSRGLNLENPKNWKYPFIDNRDIWFEQLVEEGMDLNAVDTATGYTPFSYAVSKRCPFTFDFTQGMIDSGADVSVVNNEGKTVLDIAYEVNMFDEVIDMLIEAGADVSP